MAHLHSYGRCVRVLPWLPIVSIVGGDNASLLRQVPLMIQIISILLINYAQKGIFMVVAN